MRDGEKGPLVIEAVKRRVEARTERKGTGPEELLFVTRERQADHTFKLDYYLSNADPDVSLEELARVSKAGHRIEECFERAKGEAGLADYQVRNWIAWHHHQTLSLLAGAIAPVPRISTKSGPFSPGEWLESLPGSARGY